jgi:hypothetical protein
MLDEFVLAGEIEVSQKDLRGIAHFHVDSIGYIGICDRAAPVTLFRIEGNSLLKTAGVQVGTEWLNAIARNDDRKQVLVGSQGRQLKFLSFPALQIIDKKPCTSGDFAC